MSTPTAANLSINDITKSITDGTYRIPRFQRDFVWDLKKSASLFDSIFKGYPISSIILWKTKNSLSEIRNLGGIDIPGRDTGKYTSYIIDGQQRLTSLYFALNGLKTDSGIDFSGMCISLTAAKDEQIVFETLPKNANPDDYMKLDSLLDGKALNGSHHEKRLEYYQLFLQYKVSAIEIDDEKLGLDEVTEIFERLNLGGKKLNLFSIIAARSYQPSSQENPGFDLAKKFEYVNEKLVSNNYGKITDSTFLQVISACLIGKVKKSEILCGLTSEIIANGYKDAEKALFSAIEHLKGNTYGVLVSNLLPYERLLVPFAYFHYKIGNNHISDMQERYLVDYFWRSVIGNRFITAADSNMTTDLGKIEKILNNEAPSQEAITLSPKSIFENGRFFLSSAYVVGILCLMAQANPQSFSVGRTINITNDSVSTGAQKQFHHFFPVKSPVITGNPAYASNVNNVVNIVFMDAITNNQIKNRDPKDYISEFQATNPNLPAALESHNISLDSFGIFENNFLKFLNARSHAIYNKLCNYIVPCVRDIIDDSEFNI